MDVASRYRAPQLTVTTTRHRELRADRDFRKRLLEMPHERALVLDFALAPTLGFQHTSAANAQESSGSVARGAPSTGVRGARPR
jgi:hypothetical protein